eukprot:571346-Rhodomonas_salina.1
MMLQRNVTVRMSQQLGLERFMELEALDNNNGGWLDEEDLVEYLDDEDLHLGVAYANGVCIVDSK